MSRTPHTQNLQIRANNPLNTSLAHPRLELTYHPKFDTQKNYLLKTDREFIRQLRECEELIVEGMADEEVIVNTRNCLYKLKGINVSTTLMVISPDGTVSQQTSTYLQAQQFTPYFHEIYQKIDSISYKNNMHKIHNAGHIIQTFDQLMQHHSFSQESVRRQCFVGEAQFGRLARAIGLVGVGGYGGGMEDGNRYLYITLQFSVYIIRQIIKLYTSNTHPLSHPIHTKSLLDQIPILNPDILAHILNRYQFQFVPQSAPQNTPQNSTPLSLLLQHPDTQVRMSPKSVMKFIIGEMALGKKQYAREMFGQMLDDMLATYMPVQYELGSAGIRDYKDKGKDKEKDKLYEELYNCRYEYFIDVKGEKYVYYDYMQLETQVSSRLKFLSGFKNRWNIHELRAIFRGIDFTQNGKYISISQFLLKKFRKYGDQYEIKFILPTK